MEEVETLTFACRCDLRWMLEREKRETTVRNVVGRNGCKFIHEYLCSGGEVSGAELMAVAARRLFQPAASNRI